MSSAPPSRKSNPFATCWTRGDAITYRPPSAAWRERLDRRIDRLRGVGAVIGPHGAGKSMLLAEIARRRLAARSLELLEGFERLSIDEQRRRLRRCRVDGRVAIVTLHSRFAAWRLGAQVLAVVRPDRRLLVDLFAELTRGVATPVTAGDALASFVRRRRNLREVWFDLYELHERRTRTSRTAPTRVAYSH